MIPAKNATKVALIVFAVLYGIFEGLSLWANDEPKGDLKYLGLAFSGLSAVLAWGSAFIYKNRVVKELPIPAPTNRTPTKSIIHLILVILCSWIGWFFLHGPSKERLYYAAIFLTAIGIPGIVLNIIQLKKQRSTS